MVKVGQRLLIFFLLITISTVDVYSQVFLPDPITQVKNNTSIAKYPFAGGLNNPQFQSMDVNSDGIKDLIIFDRAGFNVIPLINKGTTNAIDYIYKPYYAGVFPKMQYWAVLVDFNCDGLEDIFTASGSNVKLYLASDGDGEVSFTLLEDTIKYHEAGFQFNLAVGIIDVPGFADINMDGDLDILTFNPSGGVIDYFENQQIEMGLECNEIYFNHVEGCWGNIFESGLEKAVELGYTCKGITSNKSSDGVHAGSSFLIFDEDNDDDYDVVLGDLAFGNLNRLINGGDKFSAEITAQDTAYPSYTLSYDVDIFPAPFLVDVNNDGKKDLIVSPNKQGASENFKNVWYYQNTSTDETYLFDYQNDSLFVSDMIDIGENSKPAFTDYNQDGLIDIIIGNNGYYDSGEYIRGLALYKNIGTAETPSYELVSRDYGTLSIYSNDFLYLSPAFYDLDNDGDEDFLLGTAEGHLQYFKNIAEAGEAANYILFSANYQGIDPGINSTPQLIDINNDELPELIIGEQNGNLNYYENTGTITDPSFTLISEFWGSVDVKAAGSVTGNSAPCLHKKADGSWQLLVGSEEGNIYEYLPSSDFTGAFALISTTFNNLDEGFFSALDFADITNDGIDEMITGNLRGGVSLYREEGTFEELTTIEKRNLFTLYPNPASDIISFQIDGLKNTDINKVYIFSTDGKLIYSINTLGTNTISIETLTSGMYFFVCETKNHFRYISKFIRE